MLTIINNTTMQHVATVDNMEMAVAWAETIPYQNDFSIIAHIEKDFTTYSMKELWILYKDLGSLAWYSKSVTRTDITNKIIQKLNDQVSTSEPPPDAKRVAPLLSNEEIIMTAPKKATSKKTPATKKKVATKKTVTKKAPVKKTAVPKVERTKQNDVLLPKTGSKAGQCWVIADKFAKKAGAPPKRAEVIEACVKAGLNKAGSSADFQAWRKFHGLVKAA